MCVYLNHDSSVKHLQIAHIDDDRANNDLDNLILLCPDHHIEIHQKNPISKGFSPEEIKHYRNSLYENISAIVEAGTSNLQISSSEDAKIQLKQEIVRSFEVGDFKSFYASIFDFGFNELTRIMQWIVVKSYVAYADGVNIVELHINKGPRRDVKTRGGITLCSDGSESYSIQFSPLSCQILFDVRQFSWFNKEGKPIFVDSWDSQYEGSMIVMYFDPDTQKYKWHSFERPDIEDHGENAKNSILAYLKEKLGVN